MDSLLSNFISYTDGMNSTRQGLRELTDFVCKLGLEQESLEVWDFKNLDFEFDEENFEQNAFFCNYLVKAIKELSPPLAAKTPENREKLISLFKIYLEKFIYKKEQFNLGMESDTTFFKKTLEGISHLLKNVDYDLLDVEEYIKLWKYLIDKCTVGVQDPYQKKIFLALTKNSFKTYVARLFNDKRFEYLQNFGTVVMTSCNEILEYYATREDGIKYGPKIIYFCMDLVTHFMNLYARTEDESEAYKSFGLELNSLVVDKIFYLICKINLVHTGHVEINLGTFQLLESYLKFSRSLKSEKTTFKAEINTLMGMLLNKKLESVDKRITPTSPGLGKKEIIQVKILFDFLNHLISSTELINEIYYYNDFTNIRTPVIKNILKVAFSIFRNVQVNPEEDPSFKQYIQTFISGSILNFIDTSSNNQDGAQADLDSSFSSAHSNTSGTSISSKVSLQNFSPEEQRDLNTLMNFRKRIAEMCELLENKPKHFVDRFIELYGEDETKPAILKKMSIFLQETTLVDGENITDAIGGSRDDLKEVRKEFVRVLDFQGINLLESLRKLFWCFHMSGETQTIERIMTDFSEVYVEMNPETELKDSDTVFPFTFSLLFLNTDLHKPQMIKKMTLEEFFRSVNAVCGKENSPPVEELTIIYNSVLENQIKALESPDLTRDTDIFPELWNFIHTTKNSRIDILSTILPTKISEMLQKRQSAVKSYISTILSTKINGIIQDNIWFLVENNIGKFDEIEELIQSIIWGLSGSSEAESSISNLLDAVLKEINIKKNGDKVIFQKELAWGVYSYSIMFQKAFPFAPKTIGTFLDIFLRLNKYYSTVLREDFVEACFQECKSIRNACKFIDPARAKKGGFMNALSGFLSKESSSEGEEVLISRTSSNSLRIEAMFNRDIYIIGPVLEGCKQLSLEQLEEVCLLVMTRIWNFKFTGNNSHLTQILIKFYFELVQSSDQYFTENFTSIVQFLTTIYTDNFENIWHLESSDTAPGSPSKRVVSEKRIRKAKFRINKLCLFKLSQILFKKLPVSSQLDGYDEFSVAILDGLYAKVSLNLLENSIEQLSGSCKLVNFIGESATENMNTVLLILNKIVKILEGKNPEDQFNYELVCQTFSDVVESFILGILEAPESQIENILKTSFEFLSKYVNSDISKQVKGQIKLLSVYEKIVEKLNIRLTNDLKNIEDKNGIVLLTLDNFFSFILMTKNLDAGVSIKILKNLIVHVKYADLAAENLSQILAYIDSYLNINKSIPSSSKTDLFKIYSVNFNNTIDLFPETLIIRWKDFIKFSARRFINAFQDRDQNLAKSILEDLKNTWNVLTTKDIISSNTEENIYESSLAAGEEVSADFKKALVKILDKGKLSTSDTIIEAKEPVVEEKPVEIEPKNPENVDAE